MSVFRTFQSKLNDVECITKGLKALEYNPVVSTDKQIVRGHGREKLQAEIVLKMEDTKLKGDIGFNKQTNGTYALVYDSYVAKINQKDFMDKLTAEYGKAKIKKQMRDFPGFKLVQQKQEDGSTKMIFREVA